MYAACVINAERRICKGNICSAVTRASLKVKVEDRAARVVRARLLSLDMSGSEGGGWSDCSVDLSRAHLDADSALSVPKVEDQGSEDDGDVKVEIGESARGFDVCLGGGTHVDPP